MTLTSNVSSSLLDEDVTSHCREAVQFVETTSFFSFFSKTQLSSSGIMLQSKPRNQFTYLHNLSNHFLLCLVRVVDNFMSGFMTHHIL